MNEKIKPPQTFEEARKYMNEHFGKIKFGDIVEELNKYAGALYVGPLPEYRGKRETCRARALEVFARRIKDQGAQIVTLDIDMNAQITTRDPDCNFTYVDVGFRYAPGTEPEKPVDKEEDPL